MIDNHGDFWHYLTKWRNDFPSPRPLLWTDGLLKNGYCADCRYCCGPQGSDKPFPMHLLPRQIDPDTPDNFYLLDEHTALLDRRGCKSCTSQGCRLDFDKRPVACGLFPLVLANGRLYAYKICPATIFSSLDDLECLAQKAAAWLSTLPEDELRRISICLDQKSLDERYIDLEIQLFKDIKPGPGNI